MKIVFDLDGTICFKGEPLSRRMVDELDLLTAQGHEVAFASARPIRDLLPILPVSMRNFPMIGGNGAFIYGQGQRIKINAFTQPMASHMKSLLQQFEAEYLVDGNWHYSYHGQGDHPILRNLDPDHLAMNQTLDEMDIMVKVVVLGCQTMPALYAELIKLPLQIYAHGTENILDINPRGIDKWAGLQELGWRANDFIAFGNDTNDISICSAASYCVCVGTHPELSKMANQVIAADEDHVIATIQQLRLAIAQTKEALG